MEPVVPFRLAQRVRIRRCSPGWWLPNGPGPTRQTRRRGDTATTPARRIFVVVDEHEPPVGGPVVPGLTGLTWLARGGHATVYRAVQEPIRRDLAGKIEKRSLESDHDQRRLMAESPAAGRMSHPPH